MKAAAWIETGVPASFAILGLASLGWWAHSYTRAPRLPERPLGIEERVSSPRSGSVQKSSANSPRPALSAAQPNAPVQPTRKANSAANQSPAASQSTAPQTATTSTNEPKPRLAMAPPALPGLWPGFRGARHDNIAPNASLANKWGGSTPRLLWSQTLGEGYAAPAVRDGRVFVLDYDDSAKADMLRCFALADGTEVWRQSYPVEVRRNHGMSRTVPAVENGVVVTLGPKCHLMATDAATGAVKWKHDLVQEFGATVPEWYAGQCPLIDSNRVIIGTGGSALLVAFDLNTGKVLWKTPNPRGWKMTHSSILPLTIAGEKTFIYCGSGGIAGFSAKNGAPLWDSSDWVVSTATVPTPVDAGSGKILFTGGYNAGAMLAQIEKSGGTWQFKTLWRTEARTLGSDQQTPVIYKNHIYAVIPGGQLTCVDLSGKTKWASGAQYRFGLGPYMIANGKIFALSDRGALAMVEATPHAFRPLAQVQLLDGREAWGPLALAGTRLLARDMTRMVCVDLAP